MARLSELENDIVYCAAMYAIGRNDVYADCVTEFILTEWTSISPLTRSMVVKAIKKAETEGRLGDIIRMKKWTAILAKSGNGRIRRINVEKD